jgi:phage-related baseplate assembly protein
MIDLSLLPAPRVIEPLDYESILAELVATASAALPDMAETLALESEPANVVLQVLAYRELNLRQRINEAAQALMLAYSEDADLDQIGGNYGIPRLVVDAGDPNAVPPVPVTMEKDGPFRLRILASLDRYSTAGSRAGYEFYAKSAAGTVRDAQAISPVPGQITVFVLSTEGDGTASPELLATVAAALNAETIRPLTDEVTVLSAALLPYAITAQLIVSNGPDAETIRTAALAAAQQYAADSFKLGTSVGISGIYRALHQPGVLRVELAQPTGDIDVADGQAAYLSSITLTATD